MLDIQMNNSFKGRLRDGGDASAGEREQPASEREGHVLIIGYGPAGQLCAWAAEQAKLPYVVIEMNPDTVKKYRKAGKPIYYGDAERVYLLEHYGVRKARSMVIAVSDNEAAHGITQTSRHLNPSLHIISRARFMSEVGELQKQGADEVVAEEFETAVELATRLLTASRVSAQDIGTLIRQAREKNYPALRDMIINEINLHPIQQKIPHLVMQEFVVERGSPLDGGSFEEAGVRAAVGVTVVALKREDSFIEHPDENFRFASGDEAYAFLSLEDAETARSFFSASAPA